MKTEQNISSILNSHGGWLKQLSYAELGVNSHGSQRCGHLHAVPSNDRTQVSTSGC